MPNLRQQIFAARRPEQRLPSLDSIQSDAPYSDPTSTRTFPSLPSIVQLFAGRGRCVRLTWNSSSHPPLSAAPASACTQRQIRNNRETAPQPHLESMNHHVR